MPLVPILSPVRVGRAVEWVVTDHQEYHTDMIRTSEDIRKINIERVRGLAVEAVGVMLLDKRRRIIGIARVCTGGTRRVLIEPELALCPALHFVTCRGIVVSHNHLDEDASPSAEDFTAFEIMRLAAESLDKELVDFTIIADEGAFYSFRDSGHYQSQGRGQGLPALRPQKAA